jgi:hypothetical protein
MPLNKSMKQIQKGSTSAHSNRTTGFQRPARKAPGTRLGMLQDWREASNKSEKTSIGIGKMLRDGR